MATGKKRRPAPTATVPVAAPDEKPWERLIVGRARQHRLEIQVANCSITQVPSRAYVLGLFRDVAPSGAAAHVDRVLEGAITDLTRRRMFGGGVGEVFILPANRSRLAADLVVFAGLGHFDRFNDEVQQVAAENVLRTFVRAHVEEFATVLFGGASASDGDEQIGRMLRSLLTGFLRGKLDADRDQEFRRVTLCEIDRGRHERIRAALYRLAGTPLFENVEVTFSELPPPPPEPPLVVAGTRAAAPRRPDPIYLIVRREADDGSRLTFGSSVLTAGAKAAIVSATAAVRSKDLEAALLPTQTPMSAAQLRALGTFLADRVLAPPVRELLVAAKDRHVVVVHDGPASRLPWEALRLGTWMPASVAGMSRRYMTDRLSVAKYLEQRPAAAKLRLLLVVNPTEDLDGAAAEGVRVQELFAARADVELKVLTGGKATRAAVLRELTTGGHDILHYAGHAFFDDEVVARSGLLCARREVVTGADLSAIGNLPRLVFLNACESARVRKYQERGDGTRKALDAAALRKRAAAPAEAFLCGGIANFVGTYWEVDDTAAKVFSAVLYERLLAARSSIGEAILAARQALAGRKLVDQANFIHYGDRDFTIG